MYDDAIRWDERCSVRLSSSSCPTPFIRLRFCRSKTNCCRRHFVAVPMVILGSAVGSRGTKMFAPNLDDPYDPCACTIQLHQRPVSLRRIPTTWWTIVLMPLATKLLATQRRECCSLDSKQCPKHCRLLRWRATWAWCESVFSGEECVSPLRCSPHQDVLRLYHQQHLVLRW